MQQTASLKKPVDWDELYPGRFIKAGQLADKKVTLTIADVNLEELEGDQGKKIKGIISFERTTLGFPLNKTNGTCIRAMFGRVIPEWVGKRITLFRGNWNGEDAIRVWGSPDIEKDFEVAIQLPKRKPIKMIMHKVVMGPAGKGAAADETALDGAGDREPGSDG